MKLARELAAARPPSARSQIVEGKTNASADRFASDKGVIALIMITYCSFYSSQGRRTSFNDYNDDLLDRLQNSVPNLTTLEVDFHVSSFR